MPQPEGSPSYAGAPRRYTHSPYTPHQPLLEVHSQPAYPVYHLRDPRYGLPQPPPPALTTAGGANPWSAGLGASLPLRPCGRPGPPLREPCAPPKGQRSKPLKRDTTTLLTLKRYPEPHDHGGVYSRSPRAQ